MRTFDRNSVVLLRILDKVGGLILSVRKWDVFSNIALVTGTL